MSHQALSAGICVLSLPMGFMCFVASAVEGNKPMAVAALICGVVFVLSFVYFIGARIMDK